METNRRTRRQLRIQAAAFTLLFLLAVGLTAWLGNRYTFQTDWTASGRHTLAPASRALLERLDAPLHITAFARDNELSTTRRHISDLVSRYRRQKADIELEFVDPDAAPHRVRAAGVQRDGELVIVYDGRTENLRTVSEEALTNTLQRLARGGARHLRFLTGHGERRPDGEANHDLGGFGAELKKKGFTLSTLNLAERDTIPEGTAVLVVAGPQTPLFPGEVERIREWVSAGGNLLWLAEPEGRAELEPLATYLGIGFLPGAVVDPNTRRLGIDNPTFALAADYPAHPVTEGLDGVTLFPEAVALEVVAAEGFEVEPLIESLPGSWVERGPLQGEIGFDEAEEAEGPVPLVLALTRSGRAESETGEESPGQRIIVAGDGDFLSNTYLGNGANLSLGVRLFNWLAHDDRLIRIPPKTAPDTRLELSPTAGTVIGFGFLFLMPGLLAGGGLFIWLRRRKR